MKCILLCAGYHGDTSYALKDINGKPLLEYLCKQFNISILKKEFKRFNAKYDENKKVIIVNMKGEVS